MAVFGQAMNRRKGVSNYQRQMGKSGSKQNNYSSSNPTQSQTDDAKKAAFIQEQKRKRALQSQTLDTKFGYHTFDHQSSIKQSCDTKRGWVFNIVPTTITSAKSELEDAGGAREQAAVDLYCITDTTEKFKCTVIYSPYFYVVPQLLNTQSHANSSNAQGDSQYATVISYLTRKYEELGLVGVEVTRLNDLDEPNHLRPSYNGRPVLKLSFDTTQQLLDVKRELQPLIEANKTKVNSEDYIVGALLKQTQNANRSSTNNQNSLNENPMDSLVDIREYDVPYHVRACIDLEIRAGSWYTITPQPDQCQGRGCTLSDPEVEKKANPVALAFDIECTKAPLKFPDAAFDQIFMISYMVDGMGYLIISREIVSEDIEDFEYTPKPTFPGPFHIFNEENEEMLIRRFISHVQELKPQIVVTYNGDFFDC